MTDLKTETIIGGRPGSGAHRVVALCGPYLSGKTSLLESLLYATGAIGRRGSTRAGTSLGDGAVEARKRCMGTELNIASVDYLGDQWTFIDAPGSIEFQHDAFAALTVCDTAVVVCEPSPERVVALAPLLKFIEDRHIPHLFFINKIDSAEARVRDMLAALQTVSTRKLVLRQVPIRRPTNDGGEECIGYVDLVSERAYRYRSSGASDLIEMPAEILPREAEARREMLETLSEFDDALLEQLIEDVAPEKSLIYRDLHEEFGADQIAPVLLGAGDRENGVRRLLKALRHDAPVAAVTAKRRVAAEQRRRHGRMLQGPAPGACRQALALPRLVGRGERRPERRRPAHRQPVPAVRPAPRQDRHRQGGRNRGLRQDRRPVVRPRAVGVGHRAGDRLPQARSRGVRAGAPGTQPQRRGQALGRAAEDRRGGSLALLPGARRNARAAAARARARCISRSRSTSSPAATTSPSTPRPPRVAYRETIQAGATQHARYKRQTGGHGQFADIKIEIRPLPRGAGFRFVDKIVGGVVPRNFIPAVEEGLIDYLKEGPLGQQVVDLEVALVDGQYHSVDSSEMSFKMAARIAMSEAMPKCKPVLLEPILKVTVAGPSDFDIAHPAPDHGPPRPAAGLRYAAGLDRLGRGLGADARSRGRRHDRRDPLGDTGHRHLPHRVRPPAGTGRPHRRPHRRGDEEARGLAADVNSRAVTRQ